MDTQNYTMDDVYKYVDDGSSTYTTVDLVYSDPT